MINTLDRWLSQPLRPEPHRQFWKNCAEQDGLAISAIMGNRGSAAAAAEVSSRRSVRKIAMSSCV
jgi:hypothetical protein